MFVIPFLSLLQRRLDLLVLLVGLILLVLRILGGILVGILGVLFLLLIRLLVRLVLVVVRLLLLILLLLLVLLALPATVLVFGQKFVDLVEQFNRLLLIRGQRLRAAFDLQLLDFRRKRGNLRLSLLGERRLVGVALRLLFVGLRPGGELRAERARIVKRVLKNWQMLKML